ncbi:MAG: hypothetical protein M5U33_05490 [Pseudorhodoplanes sp.]|nr:hypothetical protein [Pseudorhodoplanes sp.]
MRNHNRLLGRVEGVDGIKTGYTRASGFNLVTSVRRGKRHIVAVVLGGQSGGARDARMRELISANIMQAALNRTSPKVAEAPDAAVPTKTCARCRRSPCRSGRYDARQSRSQQNRHRRNRRHSGAPPSTRLDRADQTAPREDPCR